MSVPAFPHFHSASCGLAALPIILGVTVFTGASIYIGFQTGGPLGLSLALQGAAVIMNASINKLTEVCSEGGVT